MKRLFIVIALRTSFKMYDSIIISNYFVNKSIETGVELTPMKLLKMVYLSHGWFMGYNEKPLINQAVEAWKYGPVIDKVYQAFKKYGKSQITSILDIDADGKIGHKEFMLDNQTSAFLNVIWETYKKYNGLQLSSLTHIEGSPWDRTIKELGVKNIIPNNYIREYYKSKIPSSSSHA